MAVEGSLAWLVLRSYPQIVFAEHSIPRLTKFKLLDSLKPYAGLWSLRTSLTLKTFEYPLQLPLESCLSILDSLRCSNTGFLQIAALLCKEQLEVWVQSQNNHSCRF